VWHRLVLVLASEPFEHAKFLNRSSLTGSRRYVMQWGCGRWRWTGTIPTHNGSVEQGRSERCLIRKDGGSVGREPLSLDHPSPSSSSWQAMASCLCSFPRIATVAATTLGGEGGCRGGASTSSPPPHQALRLLVPLAASSPPPRVFSVTSPQLIEAIMLSADGPCREP
jgi:hypothetical protein